MKIHLGYEVGTGKAVEIPLKHMAITGQTQESGKTTTLEALIGRSNLRAIAFITKRGEKSFEAGHKIAAFFQERADWEFVESILEATMKQRLKFERAWTVKACKGAKTLSDVEANVQRLMAASKRSMDQDLYMLLGEYLSKVVPLIRSLPKVPTLNLAAGLNVMDLRSYPEELQSLVISSSLRWIHKNDQGVITIIPEAWKFVPQTRNTPVKVEVEKLAREGAALKNYIWIDSQDIAGVEKQLLRAAAVWLLGVQREANEIERALDSIPHGISKPKAADIARLKLGQFYACFGDHVLKAYVQPEWMLHTQALEIATGQINIGEVIKPERGDDMDYKELYEQEKLRAGDLERRLALLETDQKSAAVTKEPKPAAIPAAPAAQPTAKAFTVQESFDNEALYQAFKKRLFEEAPGQLLALVRSVPEIEVTEKRERIRMDTSSAKGRVAYLIAEGLLDSGRRPSEIINALAERGMVTPQPRISEALKELIELGFLIPPDGSGRYRPVPGMKVNIVQP